MFSTLMGQQTFSYRALRGIQISTVFTFTIFCQQILHFPHSGWMGFAVMMIYAGFDSGATISRAYNRFIGMLLGLESGYILWFIGHLDYRTLFILIPGTIFFAYYLVGEKYSVPTVFTVNTSLIGVAYFADASRFTVTLFIVDYFVCTVFAFIVIYLFEKFWFSRYKMMIRFLDDKKLEVIELLYVLDGLLNKKKLKHRVWFSGCMSVIKKFAEVNAMMNNVHFEERSHQEVGDEFHDFIKIANRIYVAQKALYFAHYTKRYGKYDWDQLEMKVDTDLLTLKNAVKKYKTQHESQGVINGQHP